MTRVRFVLAKTRQLMARWAPRSPLVRRPELDRCNACRRHM